MSTGHVSLMTKNTLHSAPVHLPIMGAEKHRVKSDILEPTITGHTVHGRVTSQRETLPEGPWGIRPPA